MHGGINFGTIFCGIMTFLMLINAVIYGCSKGKAVLHLQGFDALSQTEQARYDLLKVGAYLRNMYLIGALIFLVGAVLCYFISSYVDFLTLPAWFFFYRAKIGFYSSRSYRRFRRE